MQPSTEKHSHFPAEIWRTIFENLSSPKDIARLKQVSTFFRNVVGVTPGIDDPEAHRREVDFYEKVLGKSKSKTSTRGGGLKM